MRTRVNGKLVDLTDGVTAARARGTLSLPPRDKFLRDDPTTGMTIEVKDGEQLTEGASYRTIPDLIKAAPRALRATLSHVRESLDLT